MGSSFFLLKMIQRSRNIPAAKADNNHKCRACLKEGNIPIYRKKNTRLIEAINIIANLVVKENDGFPRHLCRPCYSMLRGAIRFRKLVHQSQKILEENLHDLNYDSSVHLSECNGDLLECEVSVDDKQSSDSEQKSIIDTSKSLGTSIEIRNKPAAVNQSKKKNYKIECHVCKKTVTKYYYKEHLTIHGFGKPRSRNKTECKICHKVLEKAYLKQHMAVVHTKHSPKYICDVCGKTFRFLSGYKTHVVSHTNEFPFKCHLCPYRGRHSGLLNTHMKIHTRDYKYQCTECSARFLTSGNLSKHMWKHKERTHKCNTCTRSFRTSIEMERHYQVEHLGIRNHICDICEKAFGYRKAMMKHQLRVHKRKKLLNGRMPSYLRVEREIEEKSIDQPVITNSQ